MFGLKSRKWKRFKKLADAIDLATVDGHTVSWSKEINGIDLDASIHIDKPPCNYLIAVRILESVKPVRLDEARRFAKEIHSVNATIGILVASSVFEEECTEIYKESESIRLVTGESIAQNSIEVLRGLFGLVLNLWDFRFLLLDNTILLLPNEPGIVKSFLQDSLIEANGASTSIEALIATVQNETYKLASGLRKEFSYDLPDGTVFVHPNTLQRTPILKFFFSFQVVTASESESPNGFQKGPYIIDDIIEAELLKRNPKANVHDLKTGFSTVLKPGRYYFNPNLVFSYYCEEVKNESAILVLVESRQTDKLIQARVELSTAEAKQFVEISDEAEITRLSQLYEKYAISDRNLTGRFKAFLNQLDGAESIDDLQLTKDQESAKKADYFLNNRTIVCELKSLETDGAHKIDKALAPYQNREEWPLIFGRVKVDLHRLLKNFPEKEEIHLKAINAVSDSLEGIVESANRQIRETKRSFALPESIGFLIILNDLVYSLEPNLIMYRMQKLLAKRTKDGAARFPHISAVLVIHTAHAIAISPHLDGFPILSIKNESAICEIEDTEVSKVIKSWCEFDNLPLIDSGKDAMKGDFRRFIDERAKKGND
jgi:hypothetical protein